MWSSTQVENGGTSDVLDCKSLDLSTISSFITVNSIGTVTIQVSKTGSNWVDVKSKKVKLGSFNFNTLIDLVTIQVCYCRLLWTGEKATISSFVDR